MSVKKKEEAVREDFDSLKGNIVGLAHSAIETGSDKLSKTKRAADAELEKLRRAGKRSLKRTEEKIRANPGQSVAIAFVAGAILNALMRRK